MSYQINYINDLEQFNEGQVDSEQYFLLNGQGSTPQGDENDLNINNSFQNINNDELEHSINNINSVIFEHSINNIDNFMDNEYSAAPVPYRRREAENSINNNGFINNNLDSLDNNIENSLLNIENDIDKSLRVSNNIFQDNIKGIRENIYNEEKYLNQPFVHNDFSCFDPNFIDNDKDNYLLIEEDNNINNNIISINNDNNEQKNNFIERITPFPGMNENINDKKQINAENSQNINNMDAPIDNVLSNSSSQNTNVASLSSSYNNNSLNINNSLIYPRTIISNDLEKNINTFDPGKNNEEKATQTKNFDDSKKTKEEKSKKKKFIRKFKPDSLRKKIKARMHKKIRDLLNKNLKQYGSKMIFDYLPQPFITDVNVIQNKAYLKLTMRTLFKMMFGNKSKDKEKVKTNLKVLTYLDSNDHIRIKSGVDEFLNSTYEDIIRKYVNGKYFEEDVKKLYEEGESKEYIDKYNFIGKHWIEFYNNNGKRLNV